MNYSYFFHGDNNVVVTDRHGNKKVLKYQDNIEELLLQENLVEILESEVETIEAENSKIKMTPKLAKIENLVLFGVGVLTSACFPQILVDNGSNSMIETPFGPISSGTLLSLISIPIGVLITSIPTMVNVNNDKEILRRKNGLTTELFYLKKTMEDAKQQLEKIKLNDTCSRTTFSKEFQEFEVDSSEVLTDVKSIKNIYYNCGYYEKKWFKLYKNGKLKSKLKDYEDDEIKLIEEHFEEKAKQLIK